MKMVDTRRLAVLAMGLAGLMLAAAPLAAGQGTGPFYTLNVTTNQTTRTFETVDGVASFQLTLNVSTAQADPSPAQIRYVITDLSRAVEGWGAVRIQPATATVGASERVTVTVSVGTVAREAAAERFTVRLQVQSEPQDAVRNQADTQTVTLTAVRALRTSESVSSFVDEYKWWVVGGSAGVVLLGVLLTRKGGRGVDVECDEPQQEVLPGRSASFEIKVHNPGVEDDTVFLSTTELPPGWRVIMPIVKVDLGPEGQESMWVSVQSPPDAEPGKRAVFEIVATSRKRPGDEAEVELVAVVVDEFSAQPVAVAEVATPAPEPAGSGGATLEIEEPAPLKAAVAKRRPAPKKKAASKAKR